MRKKFEMKNIYSSYFDIMRMTEEYFNCFKTISNKYEEAQLSI